jgi:hypothetical protein
MKTSKKGKEKQKEGKKIKKRVMERQINVNGKNKH